MNIKVIMLLVIAVLLVSLLVIGVAVVLNSDNDIIAKMDNKFISDSGLNNFRIYNASELTSEILENRTNSDTIIVERCIGIVTNEKRIGDGKVLNALDENYNYISYMDVDGAKEGNTIVTYLVYNPDNNFVDDIMERYDYILNKEV